LISPDSFVGSATAVGAVGSPGIWGRAAALPNPAGGCADAFAVSARAARAAITAAAHQASVFMLFLSNII
jgi:hypothetical protein